VNLPLGKYFDASEMESHDGTPYPETWALRLAVLFDALDTIREAYGSPLRVVSGYRTTSHNDLIERGKLPAVGGVGVYQGWIHVDTRAKVPTGHIARWTGSKFGDEQTA
jgi:uncharacterized protein YcbK (DUF882 family)